MLKERRIRFPRSVDESIFQSALRGKRIRFFVPSAYLLPEGWQIMAEWLHFEKYYAAETDEKIKWIETEISSFCTFN